MALQIFKWGAAFPMWYNGAGSGFSTHIMSSTGHKVAFIFRIPKTGSITKVGFRVGDLTTGQPLKVSLQTVSNGNPTGTMYGGSAASGSSGMPTAYTFYELTLGTPASATEGDEVAAVVEWFGSAGNLSINGCSVAGNQAYPYMNVYTTSWAKASNVPVLSIAYGTNYENAGTFPVTGMTAVDFDSSDTPDEYAMKFSLPFASRLAGVWLYGDFDYDTNIVLYNAAGATLDTISLTSAARGSVGMATWFLPITPIELTKDSIYRISIKPMSAGASNCRIYVMDLPSAAMMDCLPGGSLISVSERTDGGAWTDYNTRRLASIGIFLDQLSDNVGGGGGGAGVSRAKFINAGGV